VVFMRQRLWRKAINKQGLTLKLRAVRGTGGRKNDDHL